MLHAVRLLRVTDSTKIWRKIRVSGQTVNVLQDDASCVKLTGRCIDCDSLLHAKVSMADVSQVFETSANMARESSDVLNGGVSRGIGRSALKIPTETNSSNLRWLYSYSVYLLGHENLDVRTVDEHLRALARMSAFFGYKDFVKVSVDDALSFKDELRRLRNREERGALSSNTVSHTIARVGKFFAWIESQPSVTLAPHLPGFFSLSRKEQAVAVNEVKGTDLTFDLALCIFKCMPNGNPIDLRNRAIVAMLITTGIRIAALITLRGKHVNMRTRWINQDPRDVATKMGKHIRTYCLNLGAGLLDALEEWSAWRSENGFADDVPFFLPDRYIQPNALGFNYCGDEPQKAECWKSDEPVQRIIKEAALNAGVLDGAVSSHDFRKVIHPFLSIRGHMDVRDEVALQLNLGHSPQEVIRKNYTSMSEAEREGILDELCRRALTARSELDLYLGYVNKVIVETDPDYRRAKDLYERRARSYAA
jgi:site-specific recombinase XerC